MTDEYDETGEIDIIFPCVYNDSANKTSKLFSLKETRVQNGHTALFVRPGFTDINGWLFTTLFIDNFSITLNVDWL